MSDSVLRERHGATLVIRLNKPELRNAFDLGYRRYEWKCDSLNGPSRAAAQRLGLSYEGVFRQHMVRKGHNRDTAWFAMLDSEWPAKKASLERQLRR